MNQTITLTAADARRMHKVADPATKILLEANFSPETFSGKITDRIKTFQDALDEVGVTREQFEKMTAFMSLDAVGNEEVKIIAQALNEGWQPDWSNKGQYKYYPWFEVIKDDSKRSGFGLSYCDSYCTRSNTDVGSRLRFKSSDLAIYAAKQFTSSYEKLLLG